MIDVYYYLLEYTLSSVYIYILYCCRVTYLEARGSSGATLSLLSSTSLEMGRG